MCGLFLSLHTGLQYASSTGGKNHALQSGKACTEGVHSPNLGRSLESGVSHTDERYLFAKSICAAGLH